LVIGDALKNLPFVQFRDDFKPVPSIDEILLKRNQDRQGVWLDITPGCNLRCVHCYAKAGKPLKNELSLKEWMGVVSNGYSAKGVVPNSGNGLLVNKIPPGEVRRKSYRLCLFLGFLV
jgi:hypothetical protein